MGEGFQPWEVHPRPEARCVSVEKPEGAPGAVLRKEGPRGSNITQLLLTAALRSRPPFTTKDRHLHTYMHLTWALRASYALPTEQRHRLLSLTEPEKRTG